MKIAVFGATGRVGSRVTQLALEDGHHVQSLVRDLSKSETIIPGARLIAGDAADQEAVRQTLEGCDLVFSALSTDKAYTLTESIPLIIEQMRALEIPRIVTIGTAGILNSRFEEGKFRFQTSESKRRSTFAAEEHAKVYSLLKESPLDWTIICPTYLPDGESQGPVRYEENLLPEGGKKITVEDTAQFAYGELISQRFLNTRVGISY
ncbi:NAD(P)-dependent oxidoreductase [Halobacillus sp. Marseille-Q1614]|uniref:NAD(P)-dependent oxidoreductase n=1 Tax=Halobacillus sp. Marseille-Q1614 TaxID=2709134 RepID=UPI00156E92EA|nr:NAD(P)H-binding protein [Halobacillus sp. Marseille-Q1614]